MWKWNDLKRLLRKREGLDARKLGAVMWPVVYPNLGEGYVPANPHVTVIYFGEITGDIGFTKEDVIDAIKATPHDVYLWLKADGIEWFGPENNIPVLRVHHDYLPVYHHSIRESLRARGIPFDETYPEYKPHVTITDAAALDGVVPSLMLAGPVELWWGGEHIPIEGNENQTRVYV